MKAKKERKASKKKDHITHAPPNKAAERRHDLENEDRPDYGGIPARDLKKNLGCG